MADRATQTITIDAPLEVCAAVATDFERYPEWANDVKEVQVVERDDAGRATEVEFVASAMGRSTRYTLRYDHSQAPQVLSWTLASGDVMSACDGSYTFKQAADGATEVTYVLAIELMMPLPGFVKRRAEVRILNTVRELKHRAEDVVDGLD